MTEPRLRRRRHRHRSGRRDRGRRAHRRGLVGDHAREGPQPPPRRSTRRSRPLGHVSNDEIKSLRRHFLGPDPFLEPRTYRRDGADGDRLFAGEVNNLPSTVGGGGFHADGKLPRFRAVDFNAAPSSARSTVPTSSTGPSTTTRWSRTTPRPNGSSAWPATRAPTRSPNGAAARTRCRPAPTCSARY